MKLKKLVLENFKGYKGRYELEIKKDINVFIGQNDVGKFTILEALDIFSNEKDANIKIERSDLNINSGSNEIIIGVVLSEFPEKIISANKSICVWVICWLSSESSDSNFVLFVFC